MLSSYAPVVGQIRPWARGEVDWQSTVNRLPMFEVAGQLVVQSPQEEGVYKPELGGRGRRCFDMFVRDETE